MLSIFFGLSGLVGREAGAHAAIHQSSHENACWASAPLVIVIFFFLTVYVRESLPGEADTSDVCGIDTH